jgi:3-dehydroquinate dehydratase
MLDLSGAEVKVGHFVAHAGMNYNHISFGVVVSVADKSCQVASFHISESSHRYKFRVNSVLVIHEIMVPIETRNKLKKLAEQ